MEDSDYSDTSDEDYIPNEGEAVSEEDDSGEEEDFVDNEDNDDGIKKKHISSSKCSNTSKRPKLLKKRQKLVSSKGNFETAKSDRGAGDDAETLNSVEVETNALKEEEEKKKADALWADFMKDVGGVSKPKPKPSVITSEATSSFSSKCIGSSPSSSLSSCTNNSKKVTVQKEYNFAGETIVVTEEIDSNSKEAKHANSSNVTQSSMMSIGTNLSASSSSGSAVVASTLKRPAGGLNAVLNKLNKKPKMSTLQKSKLDWDGFKQKEGIDEELKTHNRGKEGYLERVAFLERTDQRQFEIERNLRLGSRKQ